MEIKKHRLDKMTPAERKEAISKGQEIDRVPCMPFMGEFKCYLAGIGVWDFWHDPKKMAEAEAAAFNRYGYDRIVIGPNTRGIAEALGSEFVYPERGLPYAGKPFLEDYGALGGMEPVQAGSHPRIEAFLREAQLLKEASRGIVPIEMSIGGPFTIASTLRGVEILLRDCRKHPEEVHKLLRIIADSQKSCIEEAANYGMGIAMADPVANPALIGPKMYEEFVYPYTKELTDHALEKTGSKVSLHMCGKTYGIWQYLSQYKLNELSLDNIVQLGRAVEELGNQVPLAGNVDPVEIIMNGTKEDIEEAVHRCIRTGMAAKKGYVLATGCDIPERTDPKQIDYFMDAARNFNLVQ